MFTLSILLTRGIAGRSHTALLQIGHHLLIQSLIACPINRGSQAGLYFVVRLDNLTALALERRAAVPTPAPRNTEALSNVGPLDHRVDPAAREYYEATVCQTVAVEHV